MSPASISLFDIASRSNPLITENIAFDFNEGIYKAITENIYRNFYQSVRNRQESTSGISNFEDMPDTRYTPPLPFNSFPEFGHLIPRLESFNRLQDGWNGDHSKGISKETISRAKSLLVDILLSIDDNSIGRIKYFEAFPTNNGGMQFELGTFKREVEIELFPNSFNLSLVKEDRSSGIERLSEETISAGGITDIISWLLTL